MNTDELKALLKSRMSEYRYIHSLNVADSAALLAEKYGADPEKAYFCGLIHDSCKDIAHGLQLSYMLSNGVQLTDVEISSPKLYHAMSGRVFAEKELNVTDEDELNAVRYHTTGRAGMSLLEKVIFTADFISAERDYDDVDIMREKAGRSLDEAMEYGLRYTVNELTGKGVPIHPDTIDAYNEIILRENERKKNNGF